MTTEQKKEIPKDLLTIITYLQSSKSKLKIKAGVLSEKRVDYFKGKHAVNALCRDTFNDKNIVVKDRETGNDYLSKILQERLILKVNLEDKNQLKPSADTVFNPEDHYIWLHQSAPVTGMLMGVGVLLLVLAGVMYPLWPPFMRQGAYYVSLASMGFLGFVMALGVIRAVLWLILVITIGRGGWLFPDLFADKGVIESFYPIWSWDKKKKVKAKQE